MFIIPLIHRAGWCNINTLDLYLGNS